jgi:hypothetical protein
MREMNTWSSAKTHRVWMGGVGHRCRIWMGGYRGSHTWMCQSRGGRRQTRRQPGSSVLAQFRRHSREPFHLAPQLRDLSRPPPAARLEGKSVRRMQTPVLAGDLGGSRPALRSGCGETVGESHEGERSHGFVTTAQANGATGSMATTTTKRNATRVEPLSRFGTDGKPSRGCNTAIPDASNSTSWQGSRPTICAVQETVPSWPKEEFANTSTKEGNVKMESLVQG